MEINPRGASIDSLPRIFSPTHLEQDVLPADQALASSSTLLRLRLAQLRMQAGRRALRSQACNTSFLGRRLNRQHAAFASSAPSSLSSFLPNKPANDSPSTEDRYAFLRGGDGVPAIKDRDREGAINRELERVKQIRQAKQRSRSEYHSHKFQSDLEGITWRHCYSILKRLTPRHVAGHELLEISGTPTTLTKLVQALRSHPNFGILRHASQQESQEPSITISGHPESLKKVLESISGLDLEQSAHDHTRYLVKSREPLAAEEGNSYAVNQVSENPEEGFPHQQEEIDLALSYEDEDAVPNYIIHVAQRMPSYWTKQNFENYVKSLTTLDLPPRQSLPGKRRYAIDFIRHRLLRMILDDRMRALIPLTTNAINSVIKFLQFQQDWRNIVELYRVMASLGCKPDANTYGLLLGASARAGDVKAVFRWLMAMARDGITPGVSAWSAVYMIIPDSENRQRFALETLRYSLVRSDADVDVMVRRMAYDAAGPFLDSGGSIEGFYESLQLLFGQAKLSSSSYRFMIDEAALRGRMKDAVGFLETLRSKHDYKPTVEDVNLLLSHCATQRNIGTAIAIIHLASKRWKISPNEETMARLFRCFYRGHRYNCLRVVWKVACLQDTVSVNMRRRVLNSLVYARDLYQDLQLSGDGSVTLRPSEQWWNNAGHFVCDTPAPDHQDRTYGLRSVDDILQAEIELHFSHRFTGDFAELLLQAYRLDAPLQHGKGKDALRNCASLRDTTAGVQIPMEPKSVYKPETQPR